MVVVPSPPETHGAMVRKGADWLTGAQGISDSFPFQLGWKEAGTPPPPWPPMVMCSRCGHPRHAKVCAFCDFLLSDAVQAFMARAARATPRACASRLRKRRADEDGDEEVVAARLAKRRRRVLAIGAGDGPARERWYHGRLFNAVQRYAARLYKLGRRVISPELMTVLFLYSVSAMAGHDRAIMLSGLALAVANLGFAYISKTGALYVARHG
ncbi:hypothetical protein ANO14919_078590 [Xylariales sp. No.14919]|nr:hypothetical protein ANO14919_078590 [Xylariales sp. No.14919]